MGQSSTAKDRPTGQPRHSSWKGLFTRPIYCFSIFHFSFSFLYTYTHALIGTPTTHVTRHLLKEKKNREKNKQKKRRPRFDRCWMSAVAGRPRILPCCTSNGRGPGRVSPGLADLTGRCHRGLRKFPRQTPWTREAGVLVLLP